MRQAVDLAIDERDAAGGVLGAKIVAEVIDDQADAEKGKAAAKALCDDPRVLAVVGHVRNSGVMLARRERSTPTAACRYLTPMASNPAIDGARGLAQRLPSSPTATTIKGPARRALGGTLGKKAAVVVDDGTVVTAKGLRRSVRRTSFAAASAVACGRALDDEARRDGLLGRSGRVAEGFRRAVLRRHQGRRLYPEGHAQGWPEPGFRLRRRLLEHRLLRSSRRRAQATTGEEVRVLSAAPAIGKVPGSAEFAERYEARFGPINNYPQLGLRQRARPHERDRGGGEQSRGTASRSRR